jgi:hypothetical protein
MTVEPSEVVIICDSLAEVPESGVPGSCQAPSGEAPAAALKLSAARSVTAAQASAAAAGRTGGRVIRADLAI